MRLSQTVRRWAGIEIERAYKIIPLKINEKTHSLVSITMEVDVCGKCSAKTTVNSVELSQHFSMQHISHCFSVGQIFVFQLNDKCNLRLQVTEMQYFSPSSQKQNSENDFGISIPNTAYLFQKAPASQLILSGQSVSSMQMTSMLNPDFDFKKLGIGGLDEKFKTIFRQVFASRVCPPELMEEMGITHVKGMLLHGPPGTGKTLMARQICKMLNARTPKIVNGPEILNKFVGESEANIRRLFADAEEEEKKMGIRSALHVIIFDEIDAICKTRGSTAGSTGVQDTVVNQLLSKIDGVEQLNNILLIGMTNRLDMIDEALLRPGRLDVHMEIGLPDESGRLQILNIHTFRLKESKKLADDVDLNELSAKTKNFSGAEIEKLVKSATSTAINQVIKFSNKIEIDPKDLKDLMINRSHFLYALNNDVKAAFGISGDELHSYIRNGIIPWSIDVQKSLDEISLFIRQSFSDDLNPLVTVLLEGNVGCGKTAIACKAASDTNCPFTRICTPQSMIGYGESAKCQAVKKVFDDAYKSQSSCVILDDIESLLDYAAVGPRFSNLMLQALRLLLRKYPEDGKSICIIGTTSNKQFLNEIGLRQLFGSILTIENIGKSEHILNVLEFLEWAGFSESDKSNIKSLLPELSVSISIRNLISVIAAARQQPDDRSEYFISNLIRRSQNEFDFGEYPIKDLPFTVLDWTAEFHNFKDQNVIKCNNGIVKWSENRNDLATADLVSFHLHEMSSQPTLSNNQLTLIYVMESEANSPSSNSWQNMDFAMWYNLDRSFPNPITYFYPQEYLHALLNTNIDKRNKGIVWLCSNCGASNKRTDIVKALKQHINIDFPGHCLQNMEPYRRGQMSQDLYKQYKYVIAIENSNLIEAGSVPIVAGALGKPNYLRFAPIGSFVNIDDFESIKELADYLKTSIEDDNVYRRRHFKHKEVAVDMQNVNYKSFNTHDLIEWCRLHRFKDEYFSKHLLLKESGENKYCKIYKFMQQPNARLLIKSKGKKPRPLRHEVCLNSDYWTKKFKL
ncbi:hypothetical protein GJ496_007851 [Pomphorhynchus laevis]|nr:hypothetical protein GJ496_007851 [Pomphorhynchus laevis]